MTAVAPLVSIIIPCYNSEAYIGDAIDSALAQTYSRKEIIVVDDGSTDASLSIVHSYGDQIRWESGPNRGACAARNRGLALARGDLIQFLDADDLLDSQKLDRQIPVALEHAPAIVYTSYRTQSMKGEALARLKAPTRPSRDAVCFILNHYGLTTPAPIHWRDQLLAAGGFREHLSCAQERDLHLRLACQGAEFVHLDEELFTVRRTPGSVSSSFIRVLDQHEDLARTARRILLEQGTLTEERMKALAAFLARDARAYLQRRMPERAERYFRLAKQMHRAGGLDGAYGWGTRQLVSMLGPEPVEHLVAMKRAAWNRSRRP